VPSVTPVPVIPEAAKKEIRKEVEAEEEAKIETTEEMTVKEEPKEEAKIETTEEIATKEEPREETKIEITEEIEKTNEEPELEAKEETAEEIKIDIKTPPRVSTGIEGLDQLIGGGFLAGKTYLVSGESGTGKTIFGLQYLYNGLIRGENGIYISGEEKPMHLIVDAESLGWDLRKYVEERKLGLWDISPHFAEKHAGKAIKVDVNTMVNELTQHVKDIGAKRIVIDTIAPLVFGQESLTNIQEYIKNLVFSIEDKLECTILMTSGILSGSTAFSRYGVEEFVAEGVIVLGMFKFNGHRIRKLSIRKMRSTDSDLNDHTFEILPQKGIVIKH
jgi:circadian clock protein KaiC